MKPMSFRKAVLKASVTALAVLAVAGLTVAQPMGVADRVLLLQAKRFEGTYTLASGATSVKVGDSTADVTVASGGTNLAAALAPQSGKPSRATLQVDGRTVEGKAAIEGRTLSFEFTDAKTVYRIRLTLSGRNEGDLSVTKNDATLVSGPIRRA